MKIKDLISYLQQLDPKLNIIERRYSDYGPMDIKDWHVDQLYPQHNGEWYTKYNYKSKNAQNKEAVTVLVFEGN